MAVTFEDFDSSVAANTLKEKMIIVTDAAKRDYVKISKISKVKTGKHGAAKVMVSGKNIRTNMKAELSFPGGFKVSVVVPVKKTYTLVEIDEDEDCIYADPLMAAGFAEMETLHLNEIEKDCVNLIKAAYKGIDHDESILQFAVISYPGLIMIDDIVPISKRALASKRSSAPAA